MVRSLLTMVRSLRTMVRSDLTMVGTDLTADITLSSGWSHACALLALAYALHVSAKHCEFPEGDQSVMQKGSHSTAGTASLLHE